MKTKYDYLMNENKIMSQKEVYRIAIKEFNEPYKLMKKYEK